MSGLIVGGVTIPIASSGTHRSRMDLVDRARAMDGTYRASLIGGAARDWHFSTPPVTRALADTYEITLASVAAQTCSGDILSLPTMCCAEITGWTPIATPAGHYVSIDFALHEVQPARVLLKYSPGDTITGESFTRASSAFYVNSAGVLVSVGNNIKRDSHYIAGVRSLLLEGTRTNLCLQSEVVDNASWTKSNVTVSANAGNGPSGTATADLVYPTTTGTFRGAYQTFATTATDCSSSVYVKASGFRWVWLAKLDGSAPAAWFDLTNGVVGTVTAGYTAAITALGSSWYRLTLRGTGIAGTSYLEFGLSDADNSTTATTSGTNGALFWGAQFEHGASATSSYIATTTVSVTRSSDFYSLPFTIPPQEMSVYEKFIELGSAAHHSRAWGIHAAADTSPQLVCYSPAGFYSISYSNIANVSSTLAAAPTTNDTEELLSRLFGDGSVDNTQSVNAAASTSSAQSAANALASAWSGTLVWLNSAGTTGTPGWAGIQSFKIVAGVRSLAEMRAL